MKIKSPMCLVLFTHAGVPCNAQVYKTGLWLMHYGMGSPKRLQIRSTWKHIEHFNLGRLTKLQREEKTTIKTTRQWLSSAKEDVEVAEHPVRSA